MYTNDIIAIIKKTLISLSRSFLSNAKPIKKNENIIIPNV